MKRILLSMALLAGTVVTAQNIYQLESFSNIDLNGTARYVGMGGAMNALGADMSVMSSNPAGIGLYRKSDASITLGVATQEDAQKFFSKSKSHVSFDQAGFVYALPMGDEGATQFFNFGLNYRKSKDFNTLLNTGMSFEGLEGGMSQIEQMEDMSAYWGDMRLEPNKQYKIDEFGKKIWLAPGVASPLANMGYETFLFEEDNFYHASANGYHKAQWGSLQNFDVSMGFNFNDRWYLGLAVGLYNVDKQSYSSYTETLVGCYTEIIEGREQQVYYDGGDYELTNRTKLSGTGVDFKAGLIVRPIEDNPFRIGFSFTTPTYYSLTSRISSSISSRLTDVNDMNWVNSYQYGYNIDYDYNLYTPWRFNFSLGSTFFNQLAIGAEYEYADYSCAKISYDNGYWDEWGSDADDDDAIKQEADKYLKGVSTFKIGAEWYVDPQLAIRLGYNYVSSPMDKNAFYNQYINSASLDYATSTAYMNPGAINRITVGMGTNFGNFYADIAYMFQQQKADFYAFDNIDLPATSIKLNRSKVMITLGYRF